LNGTLHGALGAYQWDKSIFSIVSKEGMRTAGDKSFLPQGTSTTAALRFLTLVLIFNTDTHNRKQATTVQSASKSASGSQMN
jgi:hypothetical protein